MNTLHARQMTLQMLGTWLFGLGAWGMMHATYPSFGFLVAAFSLSLGSVILLTLRR